MKKLIWRLGKLPSTEELRELVKDKIITQEEAREILFSQETEEERDKKSLEQEIKFLRELVEKLSNNNNGRIIEIIREIERPWRRYDWYCPYVTWYNTNSNIGPYTSGTTATTSTTDSDTNSIFYAVSSNFSDIKTF